MIERVLGGAAIAQATPTLHDGGAGFAEALDAAVRTVDAAQQEADVGLRGLATGENVDLHGTMIALEEANIALRTMASVRDKAVEAYQSIWNMQI